MKHSFADILRLNRTFDIRSENLIPGRSRMYCNLVKTQNLKLSIFEISLDYGHLFENCPIVNISCKLCFNCGQN